MTLDTIRRKLRRESREIRNAMRLVKRERMDARVYMQGQADFCAHLLAWLDDTRRTKAKKR